MTTRGKKEYFNVGGNSYDITSLLDFAGVRNAVSRRRTEGSKRELVRAMLRQGRITPDLLTGRVTHVSDAYGSQRRLNEPLRNVTGNVIQGPRRTHDENYDGLNDPRELPCMSDIKLLSIIFEKFIKTSMEELGVDPSQSYTAAGYFWEATLKSTSVKLELLTDPEMYGFFEPGIHGGVFVVLNRFADANNKYMKDYDLGKESSFIVEMDKNGLYVSVMLKPLPVVGFAWLNQEGLDEVESMLQGGKPHLKDLGFTIEVDLEYPEELHNLHNDYPLVPEKVIINGVDKLAPNLGDKTSYVTTYEAIAYYMSKGMKLTRMRRGICYRKEPFLKQFIEHDIAKRKEAQKKRG